MMRHIAPRPPSLWLGRSYYSRMLKPKHRTRLGRYYLGDSTTVLRGALGKGLRGRVQLILTSPPYPLNRKKSYGNLNGRKYLEWFKGLAPLLTDFLSPDGSIVIELGNSWEPGRPVQSLLPLRSLLEFVSNPEASLRLVQEFVCYNPSRLPSPAQWVTVNRLRTVDSYTHVWWISNSDLPKADNRRVLRPYSDSMAKLLRRGTFNAGKRPSEHSINEFAFLKDCGGSIAHNFFELENLDATRRVRLPNAFSFSNTASNDFYTRCCAKMKIKPHPARMPIGLAAFFLEYLTDRGDLVMDPFAGSNTTGYAAARLGRQWISVDAEAKYALQSKIRFQDPAFKKKGREK